MKLWLTKNSEVSVRDQLVTQVQIGVACGDLRPGDRLPSTREVARRFGVHANTVSAAYRQLAASGTVELRKGSGIYIIETGRDILDALIETMFHEAANAGFSRVAVLERLSRSNSNATKALALFEPNPDLREILVREITDNIGVEVQSVTEDDLKNGQIISCLLIAMFDEELKIREMCPQQDCIFLKANSVAETLTGRRRPANDELIVVASGWSDFLVFSKLFLLAAKIDAGSIITCSTKDTGWKRKVKTASMIICDTVTAAHFGGDEPVSIFPIILRESLEEIREATY